MASMNLSYQELVRLERGDYGATYIGGTDPISGSFGAVSVIAAAVFATGTTFGGVTNPFGAQSFPALFEVKGEFAQIELVSGAVLAYKYK